MNDFFNIDSRIMDASKIALNKVEPYFKRIEEVTEYNQQKVLSSFIKNRVSDIHFASTTGYGFGDIGRETLNKVFADSVGAQEAIVSHSFTCGTHTLCVALFGLLRPNDTMLCVTGTPYDTIHSVIGLDDDNGQGSLKDFGINYKQVDLKENGEPDLDAIKKAIENNDIKMVYIQRSRGYSLRPSLSVETIGEISKTVKANSDAIVMVDNCYGEFVQKNEPTDLGADIIAGSLIKNAGGGVAKNGGYIAGNKELVDLCAYRATTPGLGSEVGATLGLNRGLFMGLFHAPHVVGEALKTAVFTAAIFNEFGFEVSPDYNEERYDIVQALKLKTPDSLVAFCQGIQRGAPVDSFVTPEPWDMPGYDNKVIMAAGAFTMGSTIELSADAPIREPYAVWIQGGLNFHSGKVSVMLAAQTMLERGKLKG
ncbi:MAG TPA: methionine gamma-lyase family protein [Clostridia bacterium]|nr:methionine gamma-lyase family protein [Clostridia bacterium]